MYPSTIYRVVAKALITNENGQVLVVKEKQDFWSLPGGGLAVSIITALAVWQHTSQLLRLIGSKV